MKKAMALGLVLAGVMFLGRVAMADEIWVDADDDTTVYYVHSHVTTWSAPTVVEERTTYFGPTYYSTRTYTTRTYASYGPSYTRIVSYGPGFSRVSYRSYSFDW